MGGQTAFSILLTASAAETDSSHALGSAAKLNEPVGGGCNLPMCSSPSQQAQTHTPAADDPRKGVGASCTQLKNEGT